MGSGQPTTPTPVPTPTPTPDQPAGTLKSDKISCSYTDKNGSQASFTAYMEMIPVQLSDGTPALDSSGKQEYKYRGQVTGNGKLIFKGPNAYGSIVTNEVDVTCDSGLTWGGWSGNQRMIGCIGNNRYVGGLGVIAYVNPNVWYILDQNYYVKEIKQGVPSVFLDGPPGTCKATGQMK